MFDRHETGHVRDTSSHFQRDKPMSASLEEYLRGFGRLQRGRRHQLLRMVQGFSGKRMTRYAWAEELAAANPPSLRVEIDRTREDRGRIYIEQGVFYEVRSVTVTAAEYLQWLIARQNDNQNQGEKP